MIKVSHLKKVFGDFAVLDDVSLHVEKGDIYGILGLSGAGKSTLIRCINGLETPDEGEIYFGDELIFGKDKVITRAQRRKITMIFQQFNLLEQINVLKNVDIALKIANKKKEYDKELVKSIKEKYKTLLKVNRKNKKELKLKKKEEIARVKYKEAFDALEKVDLADKWNAYPSQLSGGQKQRVAIARALMTSPDVLLSDEATSALDPETTTSILNLLRKLNKQYGLTIILISHQMNVIQEICNKVAIIDKAKIVEEGLLSEVFLNPKTSTAKKLIYSGKVNTDLSDDKFIRLTFSGNTDEPLIANIVQDCNILVSIVYANTWLVEGKIYGQLILKLPSKTKDINKLKTYLDNKKVEYSEVSEDEFRKSI